MKSLSRQKELYDPKETKAILLHAKGYIHSQEQLYRSALFYIQQLERERDAAVEDLMKIRDCKACKYSDHKANEEPCRSCGICQRNWIWRGMMEGTHAENA